MPAFLILPIFGFAAIALLLARATQKVPASGEAPKPPRAGARQFELDRGMPDEVVQQVLTALVQDVDPAPLDALAAQLGAKYPIAAGELRAKSASLHAAAPGAFAPPAAHARVAARPLPASSPDLSEASLVLQAAMKAYAEETDPVALEGFADSIRAKFPTGAILLLGRARELQVGRALPGAPAPAAEAAPPAAAPKAATYVVQPGDTEALIAQRFARDGKRWPELATANPDKALAHNGAFASLRAGETLNLPASWDAHAALVQAAAPRVEGQS